MTGGYKRRRTFAEPEESDSVTLHSPGQFFEYSRPATLLDLSYCFRDDYFNGDIVGAVGSLLHVRPETSMFATPRRWFIFVDPNWFCTSVHIGKHEFWRQRFVLELPDGGISEKLTSHTAWSNAFKKVEDWLEGRTRDEVRDVCIYIQQENR